MNPTSPLSPNTTNDTANDGTNVNTPHGTQRVLVVGATGAVGTDLVQLLLADPNIDQVSIFVRRHTPLSHPKLTQHVVDFEHIEQWQHLLQGDALFSCMGTTRQAAGSQEAQRKVDVDYPHQVARAAAANGVQHLLLVSSAMANAQANTFYLRIKGQLDQAVQQLGFARVSIVRPPFMIRRHTTRWSERITLPILRMLNALRLFRSMRPVTTQQVAQLLLRLLHTHHTGIVEGEAIFAEA